MSNTISIGKVFFDLYIDYFFETSGTASCGTTGRHEYKYPFMIVGSRRTSVVKLATLL